MTRSKVGIDPLAAQAKSVDDTLSSFATEAKHEGEALVGRPEEMATQAAKRPSSGTDARETLHRAGETTQKWAGEVTDTDLGKEVTNLI